MATTRASNTATARRSPPDGTTPPTTTPPTDPPTPVGIASARREFDATRLASLSRTEPLSRIHEAAAEILAGRVRGRVVIDVAQ